MTYKTTKKDFAEFKKECCKWIEYFGISDYEIHYYHEDAEGNQGRRRTASTRTDPR